MDTAEKTFNSKFPKIPYKDAKEILYKKIRDLHRLDYNYEEICRLLDVSKTTVFFAIKGRARKNKNRKEKPNA